MPDLQQIRREDGEMKDRDGRAVRYLLVLRQLGMLVALVFLLGYLLGAYAPPVAIQNVVLPACGMILTYYLFDRLVRVVLASTYQPAEGNLADWIADVGSTAGASRQTSDSRIDRPRRKPKTDAKHRRRVRRYLAIMQRIGVLVALVFVLGYVSGAEWPPVTEDNVGIAILGFFAVYFVFDRLMRAVLGWKYRPPQEMADRLAGRGKYDNSINSPFYRVYFALYYTAFAALICYFIYEGFFYSFLYLFETFGN